MTEQSTSWIDRVADESRASQRSGDIISGTIGTAQVAAIGKNIHQVTDIFGKPQPGDAKEVQQAIEQLRAEFQKIAPQLSNSQRYLAEDKIQTIEKELQKKDEPLSGDLIRSAGDWIVENIPTLGSALLATFIPEPVGRLLFTAGTATIMWVKNLRKRITA
jgi:hypothetical protein